MLDDFKTDSKNRKIDINIYIEKHDLIQNNIYIFEKVIEEINK